MPSDGRGAVSFGILTGTGRNQGAGVEHTIICVTSGGGASG